VSCAEDQRAPEKKRLESVTWDLKSHKLIWVVQKGTDAKDGGFQVKSSEKYEISPDDAVMTVLEEKRGFTKDEAKALHRLLDTLSQYCAESVVWWDRGEGNRLDKDGNSIKVDEDKDPHQEKPQRRQRKSDDEPLRIARMRELVALLK
jgi:hypothetical protein